MRDLAKFVPAAILVVGCALVLDTRSQLKVPIVRPLRTVLSDTVGYEVMDQRVSDGERAIAGMTDYVARAYVRDSVVAFTTLVTYYDQQTLGKTIHSPRNCLPGAGWEIVSGGTTVLIADGLPHHVNRYVLRNGRQMAVAYYWYQGRGRVTANEYVVKWQLLRDAALWGRSEESLVRVVVPVLGLGTGADLGAAMTKADEVARGVSSRLIVDVGAVLPGFRDARNRS